MTQGELARRTGKSQSAVARLERPGANPTVDTLERTLLATGHRLEISARRALPPVDEAQLVENLRLTPAQRLARSSASYESLRKLISEAKPADA